MKTIITKHSFYAALAIFALALSISAAHADIPVYIGTFNDTSSFVAEVGFPGFDTYGLDNAGSPQVPNVRFDFGSATASATESFGWSTNDEAGSSSSGSLKFSWNWNAVADGDSGVAFTIDFYNSVQTNISSISFDVMVDPASANDLFGGYGFFQVATRDANYAFNTQPTFGEELGNPTFGGPSSSLAGTWQHFVIPLTGINQNIRGITIQDFNGASDRNINGNVTIYIDNFTINTAGVIAPPTNSIAKAVVGLHQTTAGAQFDRQNLVTVGQGYSWVGLNQPISYSVTITNYPGTNFSTFKTLVFLVPFTGTIEASADFNEASCIFFQIQNLSDGTASGTVLYKVQNPGQPGQGNLFGGDPDNPQNINAVLSAPSVLGTWTLTFTDDDHFTITAPNGDTLNTNLISGDGANFSGPLNVYFGPQANAVGNIGQEAVYSNFQIVSNGVTILNDNFSTVALDSTKWVNEGSATATLQVPTGSVYTVSWGLPDAGFSLQNGTDLANPASWSSPGLPTPQYVNRRLANIPSTFVATNQNAFFRLISP